MPPKPDQQVHCHKPVLGRKVLLRKHMTSPSLHGPSSRRTRRRVLYKYCSRWSTEVPNRPAWFGEERVDSPPRTKDSAGAGTYGCYAASFRVRTIEGAILAASWAERCPQSRLVDPGVKN
jgi:hypothetical protein